MAKFCTECGSEIAHGVAFCTECGVKAPTDSAPAANSTASSASEPQNPPPIVTAPPPTQPAPPPMAYQQVYQPPQPLAEPANDVVGTGSFFGLMLLFSLPIIGLIACIIMSFTPKNKNLKHFARAMLIWNIIGLIVAAIIIGGIYLMMNTVIDYINELTDGGLGNVKSLFGNLDELKSALSSLEEIDLDELENINLDTISTN